MLVTLARSPLERMAPPGARRSHAPAPQDIVELSDSRPSDEPKQRKHWKTALAAGLMAAGAVAGIIGVTIPGGQSVLSHTEPVQVVDGYGQYRFRQPLFELNQKALRVKLEIPPEMQNNQNVSVQIVASDSAGARQVTNWNAGLPVAENPNYDPKKGILTLTYDPTSAGESFQGGTELGFDPSLLMHDVRVRVVSPNDGVVKLTEARIVKSDARPTPPGVERPLLQKGQPRPLTPSQMKHGVSRYIVFGDLHRWDEVKPQMERTLAAQQQNGLDSFRWLGGLDVRQTAGGVRVSEREMQAMREAVELADRYGQKNFIFTLLDGAIPNQTVQNAMNDPAARKGLVESLRPFVREFGNRGIIWDVANEIHGVADVNESDRQALVEDLVRMIHQEAPRDSITVGVQNYRELRHWTYLSEKFPNAKFLYTFHLYEDIDRIPNAWDLNVPPDAEIGITEADPARGMQHQIDVAARKGYSWMLFWEDARFDYTPEAHGQILKESFRPSR